MRNLVFIIILAVFFGIVYTNGNLVYKINRSLGNAFVRMGLVDRRTVIEKRINNTLTTIKEKMVNVKVNLKNTEYAIENNANRISMLKNELKKYTKEELQKEMAKNLNLKFKVLALGNYIKFQKKLTSNIAKLKTIESKLKNSYINLTAKKDLLMSEYDMLDVNKLLVELDSVDSDIDNINSFEEEIRKEKIVNDSKKEVNTFTKSMSINKSEIDNDNINIDDVLNEIYN